MTLLEDGENNKKLSRNEKTNSNLKSDNAKASKKVNTLLLTPPALAYCRQHEHAQVVRSLSKRKKKIVNGLICVTYLHGNTLFFIGISGAQEQVSKTHRDVNHSVRRKQTQRNESN